MSSVIDVKEPAQRVFILTLILLAALSPTAAGADWRAGPPDVPTGGVIALGRYEWEATDRGMYPMKDSVTLLLKEGGYPFGPVPFRRLEDGGYVGSHDRPNDYRDSTLQKTMDDVADSLSEVEHGLINRRTLTASDGISGADVADQALWPLSESEYDRFVKGTPAEFFDCAWWLRSPGEGDSDAPFVWDYGGRYGAPVGDDHSFPYHHPFAARPALSLNLSSVFFSSPSRDGKPALRDPVILSRTTPPTGAVKLTVSDGSQTLKLTPTVESGDVLRFDGEAGGCGYGERFVSCVLERDGFVKYYGRLAEISDAAVVVVSLPLSGVADGIYSLKIFSERDNGDNATDYASAPSVMTLEVSGGIGAIGNFAPPRQ
jgi:hypothetical protein